MKTAQTVAVFPDPPASIPAGLFADFEIKGRKRPSAFVASYGIQAIVVALLLIITLTTTAPVLIQKKYSAISLVAPTLSNPSPVRLPVARISVPPASRSPPRRSCSYRSSNEHSSSAHPARRSDGGCPRSTGAEASAPAQFSGTDSCDAQSQSPSIPAPLEIPTAYPCSSRPARQVELRHWHR